MLKKIRKSEYKFLSKELSIHTKDGIITEQQQENILNSYEVNKGVSFVKVLVTIGAILIGLGVLSFIASNWAYLNRPAKMLIIFASLAVSLFTAYKLDDKYIHTSRAFLYLSGLIYGAGIFLIGQMFHLGGEFTEAFLLWAIGIFVISLLFKDNILLVFAHALSLIYINGSFEANIILYGLVLILFSLFATKHFKLTRLSTFINNLVILNYILYLLMYFDIDGLLTVSIFFILGLAMFYVKHPLNMSIFKLQGLFITGIAGFYLTFEEIWEGLPFDNINTDTLSIISGIILIIYFLSLVRKKLLLPIIFTCILILRFYFDTLYDFLPKSLFFILGGLILLGFGFYFERLRKKHGGENIE